MLITEIYNGQGFGNQLACYVTTRVLALDLGYDFGIMSPEKFKGGSFMALDFGHPVQGGEGPEGGPPLHLPEGILSYYKEHYSFLPDGTNITIDDPQLNKLNNNTKIDGIFQSENQILHRKKEITKWLAFREGLECRDFCDDNICVINFRGGEYVGVSKFFLQKQYWENAVAKMLTINKRFKFVVITDDVVTAKIFFPNFSIFHFSIEKDYSVIKNAKYLILSNSSFPYFATFTSETLKYIIAPKYWGRHNISDGYWSCGYNMYRNYNYLDREGNLFTYDECAKEFEKYKEVTGVYRENI